MITVASLLKDIEDLRKIYPFKDKSQLLIEPDLMSNTRMGRLRVMVDLGDTKVELTKDLTHTEPWSGREMP